MNSPSSQHVRESPVLLVEDDLNIRESMRFLLEIDGFKVVTAANGKQALGKLHDGLQPCLILLDLYMPVMDGFEFRREQLQDNQLSAIPVVIYTGHYDPRMCADRLGVAGYFQKPVDVDSLLKLVQAHCPRH